MRLRSYFVLLTLCFMMACSRTKIPETSGGTVAAPQEKQVYIGLASFYTGVLKGKQTSSGTDYNPNQFTAAHRDLPLGTKVMVTNLENNQSVLVTITDRGPSRADRIIDLSLAAAKELNMVGSGVAKVRVEVVHE
jgi:rare lipoprotein A